MRGFNHTPTHVNSAWSHNKEEPYRIKDDGGRDALRSVILGYVRLNYLLWINMATLVSKNPYLRDQKSERICAKIVSKKQTWYVSPIDR